MPINVACQCGRAFRVKDEVAGKRVKCPACGQVLDIPGGGPIVLSPLDVSPDPPAAPLRSLQNAPTGSYDPLGLPSGAWQHAPAHPQLPAQRNSSNDTLVKVLIGAAIAVVGLMMLLMLVLTVMSALRPNVATNASPGLGPPVALTPEPYSPPPISTPPVQPSETTPKLAALPERDKERPPKTDETTSPTPDHSPSDTKSDNAGSQSTSKQALLSKLSRSVIERLQKPEVLKGVDVKPDQLPLQGYSWMVQLLPYLEHDGLYKKFDFTKPWDEEPNESLTGEVIPAFLNPSDPRQRWEGYPFENMALTHYVGMSGVEDQRNVVAAALPRTDPRAGMFGYDRIAKPSEVTDGTSQTIMIIGSGELAAPWVQGGGATIRGAREPYFHELSGFGSKGLSSRGANAVLADGSVRFISADIDPGVFKSMCTMHGSDSVDISADQHVRQITD